MNAIAQRPENRRRDGLDDLGWNEAQGVCRACYRSEAFAEDLGDAGAAALAAARIQGPASRASWWRAANPLPLLSVAVAGMLVVLGR
jgi:hypothetical protein